MGEFRILLVVCGLVILSIASYWKAQPKEQTLTKPIPESLDDAFPRDLIKQKPTPSDLINNAPLIGLVGKPKYIERFVEESGWCELWYVVQFETTAPESAFEDRVYKHFESWEYELNPDRGNYESNDSALPGEGGFHYWSENGKNFVRIDHLRYYFAPLVSLEEARAQF